MTSLHIKRSKKTAPIPKSPPNDLEGTEAEDGRKTGKDRGTQEEIRGKGKEGQTKGENGGGGRDEERCNGRGETG